MKNSIKVGDIAYLNMSPTYNGVVTKLINTTVWIDNKITGFPVGRWTSKQLEQ